MDSGHKPTQDEVNARNEESRRLDAEKDNKEMTPEEKEQREVDNQRGAE